jgi:hypothetical protein
MRRKKETVSFFLSTISIVPQKIEPFFCNTIYIIVPIKMERYLPDDIIQYIMYWKRVDEARVEFNDAWQLLCKAWTDYELMRRSIIDGTGDLDADLVIVAKIVAQRKVIERLLTRVSDADLVYEAALQRVA